jgi:hypothetical protein
MEIGTETLGDDTLNMVDQGRRCDLDASHLYEGHFYNKKSVIKENNDFVV